MDLSAAPDRLSSRRRRRRCFGRSAGFRRRRIAAERGNREGWGWANRRHSRRVKPRNIELTSEKAARARNAIKHGDLAAAAKIVADVFGRQPALQNWRFYPFDDFMRHITDVNDPAFAAQVDAWVAQSKDDAIPLLVRAAYYP